MIKLTDGTTLPPIALPEKETHEHDYGDFMGYAGNDGLSCEQRLFYRICSGCGDFDFRIGTHDDHDFSTTYSHSDTHHWLVCGICGAKDASEAHIPDDGGYCTVCDRAVCPGKDILYAISEDGTYAEVIGYEGTATRLVIADTYQELPVRVIAYEAFAGSYTLQSVLIPDSVTEIRDRAFTYCNALTEISIPDSVISIGELAFIDCYELTEVSIGSGLADIDGSAFLSCNKLCRFFVAEENESFKAVDGNLYSKDGTVLVRYAGGKTETSFDIPYGVLAIGTRAFAPCPYLVSVSIPETVLFIGSSAFYDSPRLTSIELPESLEEIDFKAFGACTSLASVTVKGTPKISFNAFGDCNTSLYTEYGGGVYVGDAKNPYQIMIGVTSQEAEDYEIHPATKILAYGALEGCQALSEIAIPDSVAVIGERAFKDCEGLTSITVPNSVRIIGDWAFMGCKGLSSIVLPKSLVFIEELAFSGCDSLSVYYKGSAADWDLILIATTNFSFERAPRYYYYDAQTAVEGGRYWYYDADGNIAVLDMNEQII